MKNPWMSMWLSAYNRAANTARGHATAHATRQYQSIMSEGTRQWLRLWTGANPTPLRKATRKKR